MPNQTITMLGIAAAVVAVGYAMTRKTGTIGAKAPTSNSPEQIFNGALPGQPGYGWDYFTNGVTIDPDGNYYMNGRQVWSPL